MTKKKRITYFIGGGDKHDEDLFPPAPIKLILPKHGSNKVKIPDSLSR